MDIAVVIVNYNTRDYLRDCLGTVRAERPAEVVVVDNGSSDGSIEMVAEEFAEVRVVADGSNPGYGAAANRGIASTRAPYVFLLNSDTLLRPGALRSLVAYLDAHPQVGIAGPRLLNPDGSLQPSCSAFVGTLQLAVEKSPIGALLSRVSRLRNHYLLLQSPHDRDRAVPWVLGAALAIRRTAFDAVSGFDERFFMYGEEVDLCYRMASARWQVHFTPSAEVIHVGGASTSRDRVVMEAKRSASAVQFYRRHYSPARAALLGGLIRAAAAFRLVRDSLRLRVTADVHARARLTEDMGVWRATLYE